MVAKPPTGMAGLTSPMPTYYRDVPPAPLPPGVAAGASPVSPQYDGVLWGLANAANVGPLRALFGRSVRRMQIPCPVSPAGIANTAVLLSRNDDLRPKFVRVRLHRPTVVPVEGRVLLGSSTPLGDNQTELVNLVIETGYHFDTILLNGEQLYALGAWVGVVPLQIAVSVAEWSP